MNEYSSLLQCVVNAVFGILIGLDLFRFGHVPRLWRVEWVISLFDYHSVKCELLWLMGIPIGLKLNQSMVTLLGVLSLLCLEVFYVQFGAYFEYLSQDPEEALHFKPTEQSSSFLEIWDMVSDIESIERKLQCPDTASSESMVHALAAMVPLL